MLHTLDTNICSYILRRQPANMIEHFTSLNRGDLWLSAIVAYGPGRLTRHTITQISDPGWNVQANPSAAWI